MTISTTTTRNDFTGNGVTTTFAFSFPTLAATDVKVYVAGVLQTAGFSVALNANQEASPGGAVTFVTAPATSVAVRIARAIPLAQAVSLSPYSPFPAAAIERSLDRLTMVAQQLDRALADETAERASADAAIQSIGTPDPGVAMVTASVYGARKTLADWAADILGTSGHYPRQYPLYVENIGDWHSAGSGTPNGLANHPAVPAQAGNYELNLVVTGVAGQQVLSVASGALADGGVTTNWACVIKHDDGTWGVYAVTAIDTGGSTVTIKPYLKKPATLAVLASIGSSALGQHYGPNGYRALAEHIWNYPGWKAYRGTKIAQNAEATSGNGSWVLTGIPDAWFDGTVLNIDQTNANDPNSSVFVARNTKAFDASPSAGGQSVSWTVALGGKSGYVDTYVGGRGASQQPCTVTIVVDGVTLLTRQVMGLERVACRFTNGTSGTITITFPQGGAFGTYRWRIGTTTWWELPADVPETLFFDGAKVVYLGDSWGEFYGGLLPAELATRIVARGGSMTNVAVGGMTSQWGLDNFDTLVLANTPSICIIEFFVNDRNSLTLPVWKANMAALIDRCIQHNIQPVVIMPAPTSSLSQSQDLATWAADLAEGVTV